MSVSSSLLTVLIMWLCKYSAVIILFSIIFDKWQLGKDFCNFIFQSSVVSFLCNVFAMECILVNENFMDGTSLWNYILWNLHVPITDLNTLIEQPDDLWCHNGVITGLSANDPSWYQAVTGKLTPDQIELLQTLLVYGEQRLAQAGELSGPLSLSMLPTPL